MVRFSLIIPVAPYRDCEIMDSIKKLNYNKKKFEVITEHGYNPSKNRNKAIKKAKGEYLVFLDDDSIIDRDYLKNADRFIEKNKNIDIVGGPQLTPDSDRYFARVSGYVMSSFFGAYAMSSRYSRKKVNLDADEYSLTSANCIVKRGVFKRIKPFDTRLFPGEDPELYARAKKSGFTLAYSPSIIIYHRRRPTFFQFFRQFFKYGFVRIKKERINRTPLTRINPVFFIPSIFSVYLFALPLLMKITPYFIYPLFLYASLVLIFSFYECIKNKNLAALPLLPFLYLSMHVSYGIGMLYSLVRG